VITDKCPHGQVDRADAAAAHKLLAWADERSLGCPEPLELTRRQGDYAAFAEVARARGDAVHFLAGLLAASSAKVAQPIP
jgi:hypothetical protein